MILVRTIFRARHGAIGQLVEGMKRATHNAPERPRILTDLSGPTNTMVLETRHASLAAYEQWRAALFTSGAFQEEQTQSEQLIEAGTNEFYTIEQE